MQAEKIIVWTGGIAGGKVASLLSNYAEAQMPDLKTYYFKELVGLVGGPAAVALAYYMSRRRGDSKMTDMIGLFGIELFIDRLVNFAAVSMGIPVGTPVYFGGPRAPPPGSYPVRISPYAAQERLPFQTDMTY